MEAQIIIFSVLAEVFGRAWSSPRTTVRCRVRLSARPSVCQGREVRTYMSSNRSQMYFVSVGPGVLCRQSRLRLSAANINGWRSACFCNLEARSARFHDYRPYPLRLASVYAVAVPGVAIATAEIVWEHLPCGGPSADGLGCLRKTHLA